MPMSRRDPLTASVGAAVTAAVSPTPGTARKAAVVLTWVSLAMAVTTAATGVAANFRTDTVGWAGWRDQAAGVWQGWGVHSRRGELVVYYFKSPAGRFDDPTSIGPVGPSAARPHAFHHAGDDQPKRDWALRLHHVAMPWADFYFAGVPHAALAAGLAVAPAWAAFRWLRPRRRGRPPAGAAFQVVPKP
jgi:hypothetical protein